jgi:hypothetical protein
MHCFPLSIFPIFQSRQFLLDILHFPIDEIEVDKFPHFSERMVSPQPFFEINMSTSLIHHVNELNILPLIILEARENKPGISVLKGVYLVRIVKDFLRAL